MTFELTCGRKFSGEQQSVCLGTMGSIVVPWKFDVLKTSIQFALEASLLGQILVLRTANFHRATTNQIAK